MTRNLREKVVTAVGAIVLTATGCSADSGNEAPAKASLAQSSSSSASAVPGHIPSDAVRASDLPVPPGSASWPVRDVASCTGLGDVPEPRLVVRVPVADLSCIISSSTNEVLIVAATKSRLQGTGSTRSIPGLAGTVRQAIPSLSRAQVLLVEPDEPAMTYVVVIQGGAETSDAVLAGVFAP